MKLTILKGIFDRSLHLNQGTSIFKKDFFTVKMLAELSQEKA